MAKVLVVAAHADDEALGCGGTIYNHSSQGDEVYLCFLTNGVGAREDNEEAIEARQEASAQAGDILGASKIFQFDFPDNQMDFVPLLEIVQAIESVVEEVEPSIIYTHFLHDLNVDHQLAHQAVMTACRPQSHSCVKEIYSFEVLSSSEWNSSSAPTFQANYIVNIEQSFDKKMKALACYEAEMRDFPHSRSFEAVEALATLRGACNGYAKAEAFHVERIRRG